MKLSLLLLLIFTIGCAPKPEETAKSGISIKLPKSDRSKRTQAKRLSRAVAPIGSFGLSALSTRDDIDCYVVFVGYETEQDPVLTGTCGNSTDEIRNLQLASATVRDDNVPVGSDRAFYVVGFRHSSNGENCPEFIDLETANFSDMSAPVIVGKTVQNLLPSPSNEVNITLDMSTSITLDGCRNDPFNWTILGVFNETAFDRAVFAP
jgi:hypothetical protein